MLTNCCAMALFRIRWVLQLGDGKWRRCRFAQFRHVLNLTIGSELPTTRELGETSFK